MKMLFCLINLILLIKYVYGEADRIVGGQPTTKGQFPFFVQILVGRPGGGFSIHFEGCGGTLVHPQWVLTAGHCFKKEEVVPDLMFKLGYVLAYMGSEKKVINVTHPGFEILKQQIKEAHVHRDYTFKKYFASEEVQNDVAIALLQQKFELNTNVKTIRLPDDTAKLCPIGIILGTGMVGFNKEISDAVSYAQVHTQTRDHLSMIPPYINPTAFYSEVKFYKGHTMVGDSGGPFICNDSLDLVQYGIISGGFNNYAKQTTIQIFETITAHLWFIKHYVPIESHYKVDRSKRKHKKSPEATSNSVNKKPSFTFLYCQVIIYVVYVTAIMKVK